MSQFTSPHPFEDHPDTLTRSELRRLFRHRRNALSAKQQQQAARRLASNLLAIPDLYRARHVAIYLPNDGEIDPHPYMAMAAKRGVNFYLPVLHPIHHGTLVFSPYRSESTLSPNRFGIPEPPFSEGHRRPAWALDAVLLPLVGFDELGGRLGMGGGFYDRTFAFTQHRPRLAPKLIGLAHECQKVPRLPVESWDVPLHGVITDRKSYHARGRW